MSSSFAHTWPRPAQIIGLTAEPHKSHTLPLPLPRLGCPEGSPSRPLVTGSGRSGTHAISAALLKAGIAVEHEGWHQELTGVSQLFVSTAGWFGFNRSIPKQQESILVSWPAAAFAWSEHHWRSASPCYGPIIKVHREPLAAIASLANGFNADGTCPAGPIAPRSAAAWDLWSWWFAGHLVPLPEPWTNRSWEEAVSSAQARPPCSLGRAARVRMAMHYWVGWNALADAYADRTIAIEGLTAERLHEVWCELCARRTTDGRARCACAAPMRRPGDTQAAAAITSVVARRHHNVSSAAAASAAAAAAASTAGSAVSTSRVVGSPVSWSELREIDPTLAAQAAEAARRYGYDAGASTRANGQATGRGRALAEDAPVAQHPRRAPRIGLFTSTISHPPHDRVSRARLAHLRRDLNGTGIRVIAIEAVTTGSTQQRQYRHIRNLMRRAAAETTIDIAIVADDDMDAAPGFESNLRSALEAMPARWRMLHLCPGWRWGRELRRRSLAFRLRRTLSSWGWLRWDAGFTSTVPTNRLHLDTTRRLIVNLQELGRMRQLRQVGGPIAFAAKREALREIVHEYDAAWHRANHSVNNDVLLLNMSSAADFVAFEPLLCSEAEIGGSFYARKTSDWAGKMIEQARLRQVRELERITASTEKARPEKAK